MPNRQAIVKPYSVKVPGRPTRSCTTLRRAQIAMGRLMANAELGTLGTITRDGDRVLVARCAGLGWEQVA